MSKLKLFLLATMLLLANIVVHAYDFEVDGIYYNILSEEKLTCAVTFKSYDYNSYSGNIIIPSSVLYNNIQYNVTEIGSHAFRDCSGLTNVTIPSGVMRISRYAFFGCSSLEYITIPKNVTYIDDDVFTGCCSLPIIGDIRYADTYAVEAVPQNLSSYVLKDGTRFIGNGIFKDFTNLTSITIPSSVISIGSDAFWGCI